MSRLGSHPAGFFVYDSSMDPRLLMNRLTDLVFRWMKEQRTDDFPLTPLDFAAFVVGTTHLTKQDRWELFRWLVK